MSDSRHDLRYGVRALLKQPVRDRRRDAGEVQVRAKLCSVSMICELVQPSLRIFANAS